MDRRLAIKVTGGPFYCGEVKVMSTSLGRKVVVSCSDGLDRLGDEHAMALAIILGRRLMYLYG